MRGTWVAIAGLVLATGCAGLPQTCGLVSATTNIKRYFGGVDQDIEWGIMNGRIYVVQSRPYIDRK